MTPYNITRDFRNSITALYPCESALNSRLLSFLKDIEEKNIIKVCASS